MKKINTQKASLGFTLIEVMIAVAIIGLLASIAYPAYLAQINKSKRATAATSILECASILERRFTITNSYTDDACDNLSSDNNDYNIDVVPGCTSTGNSNNNCFTITATAVATNDPACAILSYSNLGLRSSETSDGSEGENQVCWRTN